MKLSISNLAWEPNEDLAVSALLHHYNITAIDVVPGKYFPSPENVSQKDISDVKDWWSERGIKIVGMQSLLFGTTGLNVFGTLDSQEKLLKRLEFICKIGAGLGAKKAVFGSPKNRDRTGLDDETAAEVATIFFRRLGDIALKEGITICLEPNPTCYGSNFMTTSEETAKLVKSVDHNSIRMQLDTGALTINGECCLEILNSFSHLVGHIHISEPNLLPIGDGKTNHRELAEAIKRYLPSHVATIEMIATNSEPHLSAIQRALTVASHHYHGVKEGQKNER